ncbi:MAG: SbcC/MukB-like Walker B domain-containing protein, partial [Pseudoclavibacter sp.]|nr:SbcC/MukB-like Walker B domain-containing protein [Pseudoclavibacter sp.]
ELADAERAVAHAERAKRLRPRLEAARVETARAARRRAQAATEQAVLLHARIEHAAGELATRLHPGEPCPVCGSAEHPAPAPAPERAVDEGAIAAAEERFRSADESAERAQARQRELEQRLGEQLRLAGPLDAEGRERALAAARDAVRALRAAQTEREGIETELAGAERRAQELAERLRRLEERSSDAAETAAALEHRRRELEHRIRDARGEDPDAAARLERLERRRSEREAVLSAREEHERLRLRAASAAAETERALRGAMPEACPRREVTVPLEAEWRELLARLQADSLSEAELEADRERVSAHEHALAAVSEQLRAPELLGLPRDPVDAEAAEGLRDLARERLDEALREQARCRELQDRLGACAERVERSARRADELAERFELVRGLADALEGGRSNTRRMRLEAFVLAAELEDIVRAANARLGPMTSGRYAIEHDDSAQRRGARSGLGLRVLDAYTGRSRSTRSLSGGETFLASLALALGLADAVTSRAGGVRLETMFVDEGFGTLDADTLGVAMAALDSLRVGGRTVGVISHVEAMQEQIPAKLRVRVTERGDSVVEQD